MGDSKSSWLKRSPVHAFAEEEIGLGGDYIKSFVFGGLDGIVSTFALVAGLSGASASLTTLIAVGLAKVYYSHIPPTSPPLIGKIGK